MCNMKAEAIWDRYVLVTLTVHTGVGVWNAIEEPEAFTVHYYRREQSVLGEGL